MVTFRTDPDSRLKDEDDGLAARLGAPEGGVLCGRSLQHLLETVLASQPSGRVFLSPSLQPRWSRRIEDRGGRPLPLEDAAPAAARSGDQVWLDLGVGGSADPRAVEAFLALAGGAPEPPLVVLLGDDAPARVRTQRLAVDRPGRVLLLRETPGSAYALGQPDLVRTLAAVAGRGVDKLSFRTPRAGSRLLVLDVDGVLLDPGRAFMEAVAGALGQLAPALAWGDRDYLRLKRAGSFNNDFRLAAGALAGAETEGAGPAELEARIRAWEPRCTVAVREHYARTRWLERPLVAWAQLAPFQGGLAVCTGRPPEELASAFALLGFTLPAVSDRAPHLRKPRPEGLIQLADTFRAERITFVGDSRDDAAALRGARDLRPDLHWRFAAVGADRALIAQAQDLQADGLTDLLESGDLP
jgi:phosphoglycolate phosphatase-like HAD superfamily hydrolase